MGASKSSKPPAAESSPEATARLAAGEPPDPCRTQQMDVSRLLEAADNSRMSSPEEGADSAKAPRRDPSLVGDSPLRVQKREPPARAAGRTQKAPVRAAAPKPTGWKLPLLLGAVVVLGAAAYLEFSRGPAPHPGVIPPPGQGPVPAGVQPYIEQAKAGDAHAMRMLGVMYYYGLNVPRDREKGLYWYRKAAEKGSDIARSELSKIEGVK